MNKNKGFTLIELMAVVSIISILVVVAMSAYSDFATRAQVSEGVGMASATKTAVTNSYYTLHEVPTTNAKAGLEAPTVYSSDFVESIEVGDDPVDGAITITLKIPLLGSNTRLQLVPSTANEIMTWECRPAATNGIDVAYVPANCRG